MAHIVLFGAVTTSNSGFQNQKGLFILESIVWAGRSGRQYHYGIYPPDWRFGPRQAGNYIYAVESDTSKLLPLYIGQTDDLDRRLSENDPTCNPFGATHLCAHFNYYEYGAFGRLAEERDLIELWQPACNRSTHSVWRGILSFSRQRSVVFASDPDCTTNS